MTPDGFPLIGKSDKFDGLYLATGMCGQGFMLGPGVAELLVRLIKNDLKTTDSMILELTNPSREFSSQELLK